MTSADTAFSGASMASVWARRAVFGWFVIMGVLLCALIPAWEATDEPDHVRNVQVLASGRMYKIESGLVRDPLLEALGHQVDPVTGYQPHQPVVYYALLAGWQRAFGVSAKLPDPERVQRAPDFGLFKHDDADAQRRIMLLRLPSVLFGVATIWCTMRLCRELGAPQWTEIAAGAIVATIPRFVFLSAAVNNDAMVIACGALATLLGARIIRRHHADSSMRSAVLLGAVLGFSINVKLTILPLCAAIAVFCVFALTRRRALRSATMLIVALIVVAAPTLVTNQLRYGDPLAAEASVNFFRGWIPALVAVPHGLQWYGVAVPSGFATSWWYVSGWNQFRWRAVSYVPYWVLAAIGAVAALTPRRTRGSANGPIDERTDAHVDDRTDAHVDHRTLQVFAIWWLAACASVWLHASNATQWQARAAYPGLAAFGAIIALGSARIRAARFVAVLLPLLGVVGTLYAARVDVINRYL